MALVSSVFTCGLEAWVLVEKVDSDQNLTEDPHCRQCTAGLGSNPDSSFYCETLGMQLDLSNL